MSFPSWIQIFIFTLVIYVFYVYYVIFFIYISLFLALCVCGYSSFWFSWPNVGYYQNTRNKKTSPSLFVFLVLFSPCLFYLLAQNKQLLFNMLPCFYMSSSLPWSSPFPWWRNGFRRSRKAFCKVIWQLVSLDFLSFQNSVLLWQEYNFSTRWAIQSAFKIKMYEYLFNPSEIQSLWSRTAMWFDAFRVICPYYWCYLKFVY